MARGGLLLVLTAVWSVLLTPCCGQQYQRLDLTTPSTTCSMSARYTSTKPEDSLDCHGAINGNTGMNWIPAQDPNPNCIFASKSGNSPFWQVDLGQYYKIHKIIIYSPDNYLNYMEKTQVQVAGRRVFTFDANKLNIDNPKTITLEPPITSRRIKLIRPGTNYVTICELQVEIELACPLNRYGMNCAETCSSFCVENGAMSTCNFVTGSCLYGCKPGSWDDRCDRNCSVRCDGSCERNNGQCLNCKGHFLPPRCTSCVPGYYGVQCNQKCNDHCLADTSGSRPCDQTTGHCSLGCDPGWYGQTCSERCGENCDGGCNRDDGTCQRCDPGFHGQTCSERCGDNCVGACDQNNGSCQGCDPGWYGRTCSERCGENCDGACNRDDGTCQRCVAGYYGTQCHTACGSGCSNKNCSQQDGTCSCQDGWAPPLCKECTDGYFGRESCETCGQCGNNDVCNKTNGHCPSGCVDGFDGDLCDKCKPGRWSTKCSLSCGQCAGDASCDMDTGRCNSGCLEGFELEKCTQNATAVKSGDTQNIGIIVGAIVGSVLGAGFLIGLFILLAAVIIRKRRPQDAPNPVNPSERSREVQFSLENVQPEVDTDGNKPETTDPDANYARLENYEDPDDIRPYSMLQTDHGRPTNISILRDKENVLYQNTSSTGDKTYVNAVKQ